MLYYQDISNNILVVGRLWRFDTVDWEAGRASDV